MDTRVNQGLQPARTYLEKLFNRLDTQPQSGGSTMTEQERIATEIDEDEDVDYTCEDLADDDRVEPVD